MILPILLSLIPVTRTVQVPMGPGGLAWSTISMQGIPFVPSSVEVSYAVDTAWQLGYENQASSPAVVWFGAESSIPCASGVKLRLAGQTTPFFSEVLTLPTVPWYLLPYDGVTDFDGTSGDLSDWTRVRTNDKGWVSPLAGFMGTDLIFIEAQRFNQWSVTVSPSNGTYSICNKVKGTITLIFYP